MASYVNKLCIDSELHDIIAITEPPKDGEIYGRTVNAQGYGVWSKITTGGGGGTGGKGTVTAVNKQGPDSTGNVSLPATQIPIGVAGYSDSYRVSTHVVDSVIHRRIYHIVGSEGEATCIIADPDPQIGDLVVIVRGSTT